MARPERKEHLGSCDLISAPTHDGRAFRILDIMDKCARECLDITVERSIIAQAVVYKFTDLFIARGIPEHIRSDNGPEFTAGKNRWITVQESKLTLEFKDLAR